MLATLALVCGCSSEMMLVADAGLDVGSSADASFDAMVVPDAGDAGKGDAPADCAKNTFADAGTCDPIPVCPSDPPPDDAAVAKCQMNASGPCGLLYKVLVDCTRKYTVCSESDCKTDPARTGTSLQQNCTSPQMSYESCVGSE